MSAGTCPVPEHGLYQCGEPHKLGTAKKLRGRRFEGHRVRNETDIAAVRRGVDVRRRDHRQPECGGNSHHQDQDPESARHRLGVQCHFLGCGADSGSCCPGGVLSSASSNVIDVSAEYFL